MSQLALSPLYLDALAALASTLPKSAQIHFCPNCGFLRIEEEPWDIDGGLPCPLCFERLEVCNGAL